MCCCVIGSPVSIKLCESEVHGNLLQRRANKPRSLETCESLAQHIKLLFFERLGDRYFSILLKACWLTSQSPSRCTQVKSGENNADHLNWSFWITSLACCAIGGQALADLFAMQRVFNDITLVMRCQRRHCDIFCYKGFL